MMNTALILSEDELYGLAILQADGVSETFMQLIGEICLSENDPAGITATLQEKHLAHWDGHSLTLEPLLKLILDEARSAVSLYKPEKDSYALECPDMHLLFTRYEWAKNMWRITPYKDKKTLITSMD